jgi:hypothetical protein
MFLTTWTMSILQVLKITNETVHYKQYLGYNDIRKERDL